MLTRVGLNLPYRILTGVPAAKLARRIRGRE
jgi:hypothetical protein